MPECFTFSVHIYTYTERLAGKTNRQRQRDRQRYNERDGKPIE